MRSDIVVQFAGHPQMKASDALSRTADIIVVTIGSEIGDHAISFFGIAGPTQ